ncbi:hypothetical protein vseg_014711 [Gypsophila vaccaria]
MAVIEASQPLSIESFSYSWLINLKPSLIESLSDSFRAALDASDESSSFIEMDPNMPPSRRFMILDHDFDFNVLVSEQSVVPADELFSNGRLLPLVDSTRMRPSLSSLNVQTSSAGHQKAQCSSLRRCRSLLSRKMIEKYLYFLCPLLKKLQFLTSKSKQNSRQGSPSGSVCSSPAHLIRSCDSESSIREAVLHCKRSFGK